MTLSVEIAGLILSAIGLGFAWVRGAIINSIKLAISEMRTENLRSIAELRNDCDDRYVGKGEWAELCRQLEHIRTNCDRRHG